MSDKAEPCPECNGETIRLKGKGWDMQFWLCPRKDEPGHLSREEANAKFKEYKRNFGPTQERWA